MDSQSTTSNNFSTRELSKKTWPDFEKLFRKRGSVGDGWWCWCTFHQTASFSDLKDRPKTRAGWTKVNRERKKDLVDSDCAHGILVYSKKEPVGWCQFGPREELPRTDNTVRYRKLKLEENGQKLWRITCFVVDENYRRKGVARTGLKAALAAIEKKGGGVVEAYPVKESDQGANYHYTGTVGMFEREGFKIIAPYGTGRTSTVVMRKTV